MIELASMALALFILIDPIGNIPFFISFLKEVPAARQRRVALRELLIALVVMIVFNFLGDYLLDLLHVTTHSVQISGGIILFLISLKMVFPTKKDADAEMPHQKEPFIVPLAIPLVAGPAVLAAIMLYSKEEPNDLITVSAIVIAWALSTLILLSASFLKKVLGWRGIIACERLMGLLLTMISIEMFLSGVATYFGFSTK
jgi:multiple antibiotic resistance protein